MFHTQSPLRAARRPAATSSARRRKLTLTSLEARDVPSVVIETEANGTAVNNSMVTAQAVSLGSFTTPAPVNAAGAPHATASIRGAGANNDADFYSVTLSAGQVLHLDIDMGTYPGSYTFDTIATVYNSGGGIVAQNDDNGGDAGSVHPFESRLSATITANGTYYIVISQFANFNPIGGSGTQGGALYNLEASIQGVANSAPTNITLTPSAVNENAAGGTVVGSLTTTDPNAGDTHTYTLLNNAGGRFTLAGSTISVAVGANLDYEANPSHVIRVRTTDQGGLPYEKDLTVTVNNLYENVNLIFTPQQMDAFSPATITTLQAYLGSPSSANGAAVNALALQNYLGATVVVSGAEEAHISAYTDATIYDVTTAFNLIDENDGMDHIILDPNGNAANTAFAGTPKTDIMFAFGGNDRITAGAGWDAVFGGDGNDRMYAEQADAEYDTMWGGAGRDRLEETMPAITLPNPATYGIVLNGFAPANSLEVVFARSVFGNAGNNSLDFSGVARMKVSSVEGRAGNDTIRASSGNIHAGLTYSGGAGADDITGGTKADRLSGDAGNDITRGAGGPDNHLFSPNTPADSNTIADFVRGPDTISLAGFMTTTAGPGPGLTHPIGYADLSIAVSAGNSIVTLPDGTTITVLGVTGLNASDFDITPIGF